MLLTEVDSEKYSRQSRDKTAMFSNAVKRLIKMHINYERFEISIKITHDISLRVSLQINFFSHFIDAADQRHKKNVA